MTEAEWLASTDPWPMLEFIRKQRGDRNKRARRKVRLFACACCAPILSFLGAECQRAVEAAERYADGSVAYADYYAAWNAALSRGQAVRSKESLAQHRWSHLATMVSNPQIWDATMQLTRMLTAMRGWAGPEYEPVKTDQEQVALIRDILGNPFRRASVNRAWLRCNDGTVMKIAQGIYEERAFDRLLILHDALLDAGCDNEDILAHCRSAGPHVRGCWVIDLILGKT